jgi:hypothetical protein
MLVASTNTCNVCCSKYNKSTHSTVKCYFPSCSFEACKECVRTYLTGTANDPHCMKCRNKWNIEFSKSALNASFMEKDYRQHRRTILTEMTIAKIPEYYEGALRYAKISDSDKRMAQIMTQIDEHRTQIHELYREYNTIVNEMGNPSSTARKFVMQCQTAECRGMLSTQYKCDLCSKYTCPKCFVAIEGEKDAHECKQEDVDTVEELRKNTHPCPNCGMRISKIDGCDQMWCIECKTAFSWSKGTIERGVVHNPHYYQWMRERGITEPQAQCGGIAGFNASARRISDLLSDCVNSRRIPHIFCEVFENANMTMRNSIEKYMPFYESRVKPYMAETKLMNNAIIANLRYLTNFHRYVIHIEQVEMNPLANNIRARGENHRMIYQYILNQVDKEQLAEDLIRTDNMNMKDRAYLDILDAFVMVGKQIMIDCLAEMTEKRDPQCTSLYEKFEYGNDNLKYNSAKFISQFVIYEYLFTCDKMANYHKMMLDITDKYMTVIKKYCAYSTGEALRFLLIYNSKKSLPLWDYMEGRSIFQPFKNKTQIQQLLEQHKTTLDELNSKDTAEAAVAKEEAEAELENVFIPNV